MSRIHAAGALVALGLLAGACRKEAPAPLYEPVAVTRRDIVVAAEAAGTIEPILVIDVKSKASGEIIELRAETGDIVNEGELLVSVDPRLPRNAVAQAEADIEVARAQLSNAESQKRRSDQMFEAQLVSEQEHEQANLAYASARAQLVRAERSLQTARDQLDDTSVRAPITGTIIQKNVERGQVIASAISEVSGGTVLLRMADLSVVQVRTLVDETDIGKIQPNMPAQITVDAYPNQPFEGTVLKIEPQSTVTQNVTMFPVLIRIGNERGLLRPGMSAQVAINVASQSNVLAIPNAALRTQRDVASAAQVLGINPDDVQQILARADSQAGSEGGATGGPAQQRTTSLGAQTERRGEARTGGQGVLAAPAVAQEPAAPASPPLRPQAGGRDGGEAGNAPGQGPRMRPPLPEGVTEEQWAEIRRKRQAQEPLTPRESTIAAQVRQSFQRMGGFGGGPPGSAPGSGPQAAPAQAAAPSGGSGPGGGTGDMRPSSGVSEDQMRAIFNKLRNQQPLTAQEQAIMSRMRSSMGQSGTQRRRFGAGNNFQFGGSYIVFVLREGRPTPARIRTGVTDMDYSQVVSGLTEQDTVLLLPSASLVQAQQQMRERFQRMGGGGVPGMQQQPSGGGRTGGGPPR